MRHGACLPTSNGCGKSSTRTRLDQSSAGVSVPANRMSRKVCCKKIQLIAAARSDRRCAGTSPPDRAGAGDRRRCGYAVPSRRAWPPAVVFAGPADGGVSITITPTLLARQHDCLFCLAGWPRSSIVTGWRSDPQLLAACRRAKGLPASTRGLCWCVGHVLDTAGGVIRNILNLRYI
jgi:hypothetical protein